MGAISVTRGELPATRLAFRVTEAATLIGVSAAYVRLELARGNLNATRLGRRIVLTRVELDRYLASRQTTTAALGARSAEGTDVEAAGKAPVALRGSMRKRETVPRPETR